MLFCHNIHYIFMINALFPQNFVVLIFRQFSFYSAKRIVHCKSKLNRKGLQENEVDEVFVCSRWPYLCPNNPANTKVVSLLFKIRE